MHLVMFDIDGTLVDTSAFEDDCFIRAITDVLDIEIHNDWSSFPHVSDSGIVHELLKGTANASQRKRVFQQIRTQFIGHVKSYLRKRSAPEIPGASMLLKQLREREDTVLCFATGGWKPTALLKLESAGIDYSKIVLASSDDHYDRTEIMKIAENRAGEFDFASKTYIGDGIWDKEASSKLGYNFILIGNNAVHNQQIQDYSDHHKIMSLIGLKK